MAAKHIIVNPSTTQLRSCLRELSRRWVSRARIPALCLVCAVMGSVSVHADTDTGSSHNFFLLNNLDRQKYAIFRANLVSRDGFEDFFFAYLDAAVGHRFNKKWAFEGGYRQAYLELRSGWRREYRPHFNLVYRGKLGEWTFRNRHRLEFRVFEGDADSHVRYRNESVWTAPYTFSEFQLRPFVSEEFFYSFNGDRFNINWLTTGVSGQLTTNTKWKIAYRLQSQKFGDDWNTRHVLVTGISILNF